MESKNSEKSEDYLLKWLQKVVDAVGATPTKGTSAAYLEELLTWRLTDDQWERLRTMARRRLPYFPGRMPGIPELIELRDEITQQAAAQEAARKALTRDPDAIPCPPELRLVIGKL
jgi:hypothetical protein